MDGIKYITDKRGDKTAVMIDPKEYEGLWENIHNMLVIESTRNKPGSPWTKVKRILSRNQEIRE